MIDGFYPFKASNAHKKINATWNRNCHSVREGHVIGIDSAERQSAALMEAGGETLLQANE